MIKNLYLNIPQSTLYRIRISLCTQSSIEPHSLASHFQTERSIYRIVYLFLRLGLLLSLICHHFFSCSFQFLSSELLKVFFKNCCDLVPPCLCICPFNDIIVTAATWKIFIHLPKLCTASTSFKIPQYISPPTSNKDYTAKKMRHLHPSKLLLPKIQQGVLLVYLFHLLGAS